MPHSITVHQIDDLYASNPQYIISKMITLADKEDFDFNDHQFGNGDTKFIVINHGVWYPPMQSTNYFPAIDIDRIISHDKELGPTMIIIEWNTAQTAVARFHLQAKEDEAKRRAEQFAHLTGLFLCPWRCIELAVSPAAPRKRRPPLTLKSTYDLCKSHDFESAGLSSSASCIAKPQGLLNRQRKRICEDFGNGSEVD